jgi:hypothetical protein
MRGHFHIGRTTLRARGGRLRDEPAARRQLERVLSDGVPVPGLSGQAVLCVRELVDPSPGLLDLSSETPSARWRHHLGERLAQLARTAVRPAREPGARGDVVLFEDERELLLCLARDLGRGMLADHWWWRVLLSEPPVRRLCAAWRAEPESVPPVLTVLAAEGLALPLLRSLPTGEVVATTEALTARHGLHAMAQVLAEAERPNPAVATATESPHDCAPPRTDDWVPPWSSWAPELTGERPGAPETLLLMALTLQRAPVRVRSPAFAAAVRAWRTNARSQTPTWSPPAPTKPGQPLAEPGESPEVLPGRPPEPNRAATGQRSSQLPAVRLASPAREQPVLPERKTATAAAPASTAAPPATTPGHTESHHATALPVEPPPPRPATPAAHLSLHVEAVAPPFELQRLRATHPTDLGGLFFLLNVGLFFELYGDFTRPLSPGISLPPWEFVSMVGRWLLGETAADTADDPAWAVLARLTARPPGEPEGDGFVPDQDWRVPLAWLKPFPEPADCVWSADEHGVRLRHPAGFSLVELGADPPAADPAAARRRWLDNLGGYLRARLPRALGLADATSLSEVLLRLPARISMDDTRVDVSFSLASYPLAVRLAGLDRDPGWIPAAGRDVRFHFT